MLDETEFQDPQLKKALTRAWGSEVAPAALREKLAEIARAETVQRENQNKPLEEVRRAQSNLRPQRRVVSTWMIGSFSALALAALVLLAFGLHLGGVGGGLGSSEAKMPMDVAQSFVKRHDICVAERSHEILHTDDYLAIGNILSTRLKIPVLSHDVGNWKFMGAGPCPVWGHASGHLLYRNGSNTLSVFSIPVNDFAMAGNQGNYQATVGAHQLAAFVRGNGLYCIVVDSADPSAQAEASAIRDQLQNGFNADSVNSQASAAINDLVYRP